MVKKILLTHLQYFFFFAHVCHSQNLIIFGPVVTTGIDEALGLKENTKYFDILRQD